MTGRHGEKGVAERREKCGEGDGRETGSLEGRRGGKSEIEANGVEIGGRVWT
jgi:hypothetical protein